jgi:tRNA pseudouridine55 synthase
MQDDPKIFAVNKPVGPTSHDVMYQIKRKFRGEKVGHAGTLDPLASGVLVVGVGRSATKLLHTDLFNEKEYIAEITLGQTSTTDDAEGEKTAIPVTEAPTLTNVEAAIKGFVGTINQIPPIFSAIKNAGVPAYKMARRGEQPSLVARLVVIKDIELIRYEWPLIVIRAVTGRGVYIRSLARDVGEALGVGGFMSKLERTRVGNFCLKDVIDVAELK